MRHGGQLLRRAALVCVAAVGISRIYYRDVFQAYVLDAVTRRADDAAGRDVPRQILDRPFVAVAEIGFFKWHLRIHVADGDVAQAWGQLLVGVALRKAEENRVAGVVAAQAVDVDVLQYAAIHAGDGDRAAVGVKDGDVLEAEIAEHASGHGAELDAVGAAAPGAVLHHHIFAHAVLAVALEAEHIVGGIHVAVAYDHILAVHNVDAVVVPE